MDSVIVLANGSHAQVRDLYFSTKIFDFATNIRANAIEKETAVAKGLSNSVKVIDSSGQASVSQTYIFGGVPYEGSYEVTPTAYEQSLFTKSKVLRNDITVHKVPYFETTNESGGYTVSILS